MKIIHFSDTHLGFGLLGTTRDDDFYNNFETAIDLILTEKPDFVIHSGDLFHSSNPSNKAVSIAVRSFLRLSQNGIKTIIIAGNHSKPRLSTTTCPLEIFSSFENIYTAFGDEITTFSFDKANFVCLPHIHNEEIFKEKLSSAKEFLIERKKNIFVSHFGLQAKEYDEYTDEISGVNIDKTSLENLKNFDYVALGHYHKNFCLAKNICYSGSTEHTSFNQKDYDLGINILFFEEENLAKKIIPLETRKMLEIKIDTADFENFDELKKHFLNQTFDIKGKIVKIFFENMSSSLLLTFNDDEIYKIFAESFYFEYKKLFSYAKNSDYDLNFSAEEMEKGLLEDFIDKYEILEKYDREAIKTDILELLNNKEG